MQFKRVMLLASALLGMAAVTHTFRADAQSQPKDMPARAGGKAQSCRDRRHSLLNWQTRSA
jgi:hypothetical protein